MWGCNFMDFKLGENIKAFRRLRGMTQEQLAEAMGVTVGSVSKWESGQSVPELQLIVALADFFEQSVDALLGCVRGTRGPEETAELLSSLMLDKKYGEGLAEARKAVQKFPNSLTVIRAAARMSQMAGLERSSGDELRQALTLYMRARELVTNSEDAALTLAEIDSCIGEIYVSLGDNKKAIERFRRSNIRSVNDGKIGFLLVDQKHYDEAMVSLSSSFIFAVTDIFRAVTGLATCLSEQGGYSEAIELLGWARIVFTGLKPSAAPCYADKLLAGLFAAEASVCKDAGLSDRSEERLREALTAARRFDTAPDFSCAGLRFYHGEPRSLYDDLGESAEKMVLDISGLSGQEVIHKLTGSDNIKENK